MKRLTILFIVLCLPIVMAEERDRQATNRLPIYRGAEPHITELLAVTPTWGGTVTIGNFEQWLESYPQSMLPWKPEELKDVKIYLPLGEGESIDDKIYRFQVAWGGKETPAPLHIVNDRASWEKWQHAEEPNSPLHSRAFRYRPLEMEKDNVVRFKFEFVPVKFKPIATWEGMGNMMRFTNAPVPEFLDPLVINTAQMRVLVNERSDGFSIHFSNDGERWYSVSNRPTNFRGQTTMPRNLLPFETLYVRIATNNNVPIGSFSLDFEAILETRGFRGTGTTGFGRISTNRVNFPLAFYDGNDDLVLLIDNPGEEPFQTGSHHRNFRGGGFSYSFSSPRGGGMGGSGGGGFGSATGGSFGPIVPANSTGVYIYPTDKGMHGLHGYMLNGFTFYYQSERDPMSPNPPPNIVRIFADSQRGELTPRSDSSYVRFED